MAYKRILYETLDNIATIMMNRPDKRNAQDYLMLDELADACKTADLDERIRVIILGGTGECFSAGHDLSGSGEPSSAPEMQTERKGLEWRLTTEQHIYFDQAMMIRNTRKPLIAMVQGHCIAGGLMIAAMCDIIYASEDALFSNPVVRMTPAGGEILMEPWDLGPRMAKEFLWTGDAIDAIDAHRLGLVNKVVPREKLEEAVLTLARRIAQTPPIAVELVKRSINRMQELQGLTHALDYHFLIHQLSHNTREQEELARTLKEMQSQGRLKEFLQKRDEAYRTGE